MDRSDPGDPRRVPLAIGDFLIPLVVRHVASEMGAKGCVMRTPQPAPGALLIAVQLRHVIVHSIGRSQRRYYVQTERTDGEMINFHIFNWTRERRGR